MVMVLDGIFKKNIIRRLTNKNFAVSTEASTTCTLYVLFKSLQNLESKDPSVKPHTYLGKAKT